MGTKSNPKDSRRRTRKASSALLLTAREVARMLRISRSHLWRMNKAGMLPDCIRLGTAVRWRRKEIEGWVDHGLPPRDRWNKINAPERRAEGSSSDRG